MNLAPVTDLLRARIGLEPEALGATALANAVATRMQTVAVSNPADYTGLLQRDPCEFQTLVELLVVPESWFLRGGEAFAYLARQVADRIALRPAICYRILSVPCSTGEEPYSLVIALVEAGVPSQA